MKSRESNQRLKNVVPLSLLFDHQSTPRAPPPRPRPPPFPSRSSPLWTFFCFFDHIRSLQEVRIACSQKELKNENGPGGKKGCGGLLVTFLFLSTLSLAPPFSLGSVGVGVGREEGDDGSRKSRSPISVVSCPKTSIPFIIDAR